MRNLFLLVFVLVLGCNSNPKKDEQVKENVITTPKMENLPAGEVTFIAPDGWLAEVPSNPMRKSQYRLPGPEGDAELAVFNFPGTGGTVDANLDRWYGQFKQSDGGNTKDKVVSETKEVNGLKVTVVYVTGIYLKPRDSSMMGGPVDEMANYAMRAAIVETANGPWFYKAVGPQRTIDNWKKAFDEMVATFNLTKKTFR
jgi:hypothetical protein